MLRKPPTTVAQRRLADALGALAASESAELAHILKKIVEAIGDADAPARMMFDEASEKRGRVVRASVKSRRPRAS